MVRLGALTRPPARTCAIGILTVLRALSCLPAEVVTLGPATFRDAIEAVNRGSDLWYESPGRPEAEADAHSAEADAHSAEADEVQIGGLPGTTGKAPVPGHLVRSVGKGAGSVVSYRPGLRCVTSKFQWPGLVAITWWCCDPPMSVADCVLAELRSQGFEPGPPQEVD